MRRDCAQWLHMKHCEGLYVNTLMQANLKPDAGLTTGLRSFFATF